MRKIKLSLSDINIYIVNLRVLRAFPQVSFLVNKSIQKNIIKLTDALSEIDEQIKILQDKKDAIDSDLTIENKNDLINSLNKEYIKIKTSSEYEVEIIEISQSEFPLDQKDWGVKEVTLENGTISKESYLEAFLVLLDIVFVEQ